MLHQGLQVELENRSIEILDDSCRAEMEPLLGKKDCELVISSDGQLVSLSLRLREGSIRISVRAAQEEARSDCKDLLSIGSVQCAFHRDGLA